MPGFSDAEYLIFCKKTEPLLRLRLSDYKSDQMARRIALFAEQLGADSFAALLHLLERGGPTLDSFRRHLTINVTSLLRNPILFEALKNDVLPLIPGLTGQELFRVWSAGCSYGAEAFTLAMILREAMDAPRIHVLGTDVDAGILAKALVPRFSDSDMANVSDKRARKWFKKTESGDSVPLSILSDRVSFLRHDLLVDPYPTDRYDLILCRNVIIYFSEPARQRVFASLAGALKPGGVLFVGGTERIQGATQLGLDSVSPFFYQRKTCAKSRLAVA